MEKTKTKKKKSKRLRRRIGLIAIGGLSMVLTVCLSVGATLAWFAGSTWASNDLYMGGPVYVEMAGRGGTANNPDASPASWIGGDGKLDIIASGRTTGTADKAIAASGTSGVDAGLSDIGASGTNGSYASNVLLPGQKMLIYSQARVFSTAYYDDLANGAYANQSSGANTQNTTNGTASYTDSTGKKKSTTTSVLRAKFSIEVEFDPTMGFNNFTDPDFAENYPQQSQDYTGEVNDGTSVEVTETDLAWEDALTAATISAEDGRRDAVGTTVAAGYTSATSDTTKVNFKADGTATTTDGEKIGALLAIKKGYLKSIYKWTYVSQRQYEAALADTTGATGMAPMGYPFDGTVNSVDGDSNLSYENGGYVANPDGTGNGYFGVWVLKSGKTDKQESDSFFKARTNDYLKSYKEHIVSNYGSDMLLTIGDQVDDLENALNQAFVKLVNESSNKILGGYVHGFDADNLGAITNNDPPMTGIPATWLYVDPKIGNDTNASDSATSVGGWWYLVESDSGVVGATTDQTENGVTKVVDYIDTSKRSSQPQAADSPNAADGSIDFGKVKATDFNSPQETASAIKRSGNDAIVATNKEILKAKLYEITPSAMNGDIESLYNGTTKVVSVSFPFVNGNFELPGKELTNIFACAKISFHISFQALQAFFPFTPSIDAGCQSGSTLAGTGKALNIENAIPIYNEAFDYLGYINSFTSR